MIYPKRFAQLLGYFFINVVVFIDLYQKIIKLCQNFIDLCQKEKMLKFVW